jgi:hypothetical protein
MMHLEIKRLQNCSVRCSIYVYCVYIQNKIHGDSKELICGRVYFIKCIHYFNKSNLVMYIFGVNINQIDEM